eukprot:scaffold2280_cov430-Prasinococcus_capsulatus_cf.AAC.17
MHHTGTTSGRRCVPSLHLIPCVATRCPPTITLLSILTEFGRANPAPRWNGLPEHASEAVCLPAVVRAHPVASFTVVPLPSTPPVARGVVNAHRRTGQTIPVSRHCVPVDLVGRVSILLRVIQCVCSRACEVSLARWRY